MNEKRWIMYYNNIICMIGNSYKLKRKKRLLIKPTSTQSYQQQYQQ